MKKTLLMSAALAALLIAAPANSYAMGGAKAEDVNTEQLNAADEVEVQELTLENGTKVHVKGDAVFVVDADGNEMPAPDGEHTLEDGKTIITEDGKIVE